MCHIYQVCGCTSIDEIHSETVLHFMCFLKKNVFDLPFLEHKGTTTELICQLMFFFLYKASRTCLMYREGFLFVFVGFFPNTFKLLSLIERWFDLNFDLKFWHDMIYFSLSVLLIPSCGMWLKPLIEVKFFLFPQWKAVSQQFLLAYADHKI